MGGGFALELGKFGADGRATGEVMDDEGRRRVGLDMRRGNAQGEVGTKVFPKAISFKAAGIEFPPVHCILVALLILVNEVQVGLDGDLCPLEVFQFCVKGEFSHVSDGMVYLVFQFGTKQELLALLGREGERVGYRR